MNPGLAGTPIATTFVSATQLTATMPASFMAGSGSTNSLGVQNPPPGGGTTVTTSTVTLPTFVVIAPAPTNDNFANAINITRSEEHTSELQSLRHLVCRLLLEKKNKKKAPRRRRSQET